MEEKKKVSDDKKIVFSSEHQDEVHDMQYDYYGTRIATCSSDHHIKVWDQNEDGEGYDQVSDWKAHDGPIWRVAWAHPEFGQILASCSSDQTVRIWSEDKSGSSTKWQHCASLVDSKGSVQDLSFAPRHQGARLALACMDGYVRVYELQELVNLNSWSLSKSVLVSKSGCTCVSWNPSVAGRESLAVGTRDGAVFIYEPNSNGDYESVSKIDCSSKGESILSVSWAPRMGRSFDQLATGGKDSTVRVYRIREEENNQYDVQEVGKFEEHGADVWKVSWNVIGTVLASSGGDGILRLWKENMTGKWTCVKTMNNNE